MMDHLYSGQRRRRDCPIAVDQATSQRAMSQTDTNAVAWLRGRSLLERTIEQLLDFALETTLGGSTIPKLLLKAASNRISIRV
jgi:hypothetical protein